MDEKIVNIFVPGRVSIIGEISDFVCDYKKYNDNIICGSAIATSIENGIYAIAKKSDKFIFKCEEGVFECKMKNKILEKEAVSESFFSYVCGVALYINQCYDVGGIDIDVKYNDLNIKKGLASSAAISVLVAKAFNLVYELDLESYEIMKIAYEGEHIAKSMCGRLNQICAKGISLSKIDFEKECLNIERIDVKEELNYVIVDLDGQKDTKNILAKLHSCLPFPKNPEEMKLFELLCRNNNHIVEKAKLYIENGDKKALGRLLIETQRLTDEITDFLGDDFKLPKLHELLNDKFIQSYIYGAKSVGYGGDGAVELLAKDKESQLLLEKYINENLGLKTHKYNINRTHKIKNAVIYLSNCNEFNRVFETCRKLDEIGIEKIYLVIDEKKVHLYNNMLNKNISSEKFDLLSEKEKIQKVKQQRISQKIEYITLDRNSSIEQLIYSVKEVSKERPVLFLRQQACNNRCDDSLKNIIEKYDEIKIPFIYNENCIISDNSIVPYNEFDLDRLYLASVFVIDNRIYKKIQEVVYNGDYTFIDNYDEYNFENNMLINNIYDFDNDENMSFSSINDIIDGTIYNFNSNIDDNNIEKII